MRSPRISHLLTVSRPRFWLYLAGPVLVGAFHGAATRSDLLTPSVAVLFLYFLVPANLFLYGINDIFDADVDAGNPRKGTREARYRGDPDVRNAALVGLALGLGPFAVVPPDAWPALLGFFLLAIAYSVPPVRFKARPGWDSLSNGLYVLPGFAAYVALAGQPVPWLVGLGAWVWAMGMHTFSAIPDIDSDLAAGIQTTATRLGPRGALAYCGACWLVAALAIGARAPGLGALVAIYPALALAFALTKVPIARAYGWFPWINATVGMAMTVAGWLQLGA